MLQKYLSEDVVLAVTVISVKKHTWNSHKETNKCLYYTVTKCTEILLLANPLKPNVKMYH